jgi:hypothetical protein
MPVARHKARAPAMLRPWVVVRERYAGMAYLVCSIGAASLANPLAARDTRLPTGNACALTATLTPLRLPP